MDDHQDDHLYPLALQPILKEKVWGGQAIYPLLHRNEDAGDHIGEAWIVFGENTIANGSWQGRTLDDVVAASPEAILGTELAQRGLRQFPLLAKFLDAHENLSVQVHPDDLYAKQHEGVPFGKAEFWYILNTEPDARIIHGPARAITRGDLDRELREGNIEALQSVPVSPGDVILNLPGMIHATGQGVVLYELQQSSDITYRLYDWDRGAAGGTKRELHLESGLDVAQLQPLHTHKITPLPIESNGAEREILCACRYFAADLVALSPGSHEHFDIRSFNAWTVLSGTVTIRAEGGEWTFGAGSSFVVPAGLSRYEIAAGSEPAKAIRAYVPDLQRDVVDPLLAREVSRERIEQLAGETGAAEFEQGE
jgi:mannose-6-phosphate isomerase